ncbi:MAG: ATP-binding cassette domain-containing protein [Caldilineaceae bacterium]
MRIPQGSFVSLKGRSGSGKTTLLNCLGGLDQPTKGDIRIMGQDISKWRERQLTAWRRRAGGLYFPIAGLPPALSAYENVELMLRMNGVRQRAPHAPWSVWSWWGSPSGRTTVRMKCLAASSSAWPLRAPWPTARR